MDTNIVIIIVIVVVIALGQSLVSSVHRSEVNRDLRQR